MHEKLEGEERRKERKDQMKLSRRLDRYEQ